MSLYTDPMFVKVIYNLMDNALRHGGDRLSLIRIHGMDIPDGYSLIFENNGRGIPAKDKTKIFNRVVGKDTAVGLFLVREILSLTGITIQETGEPDSGVRFELNIPKGAYRIVSGVKG